MATPWPRIAVGLGISIVIAIVLLVPSIGTVSTWKIVVGAVGLIVFLRAGRADPKKSV